MADNSISINKFIEIFSTTAGTAATQRRQPIARLFSSNELIPVGSTLRFTNADEVSDYFGSQAQETTFAKQYFRWISTENTRAKAISFDRLSAGGAAYVKSGINIGNNLDALKSASFLLQITYKGTTINIHADTASATSLSDIADVLNNVSVMSGFAQVVFSNNENGSRFTISAIDTDEGEKFSIEPNEFAIAMGWTASTFAINSAGIEETPIVEQVSDNLSRNNNCFTIGFIQSLANDDLVAVSEWISDRNDLYVLCYGADKSNIINTLQPLVAQYNDVWLQCDNAEQQFYMPMAITANIDFNKPHQIPNYMFKNFDINANTATVSSTRESNQLDLINVNYYGYVGDVMENILQRGKLQGKLRMMNVAVGAIWLKDAMTKTFWNLFRRAGAIYTNPQDMAKIAGVAVNVFNEAIVNGVFLQGTTLTADERADVTYLTDDPEAYAEIEQRGYIFQYEVGILDSGERTFKYRVIYKGSEVINKVEGTHIGLTTAL